MSKIPQTVHFVFGLREQDQPFHLLHYLAIESCRQVLQPKMISLYYQHLPYGVYWDMIRPRLSLVKIDPVREVEQANYNETLVPEQYRYAHHADFIRLDALIEHGGIYADIDTLFLRPIPEALFGYDFVIGREAQMPDEITGEMRSSLCNALMMAAPGSIFAREWRKRMAGALNGTWSNHSCFLASDLANEQPAWVHIEPKQSFMGIPFTPAGLTALLEGGELDLDDAYSVHLWQHVWWEEERRDFSRCHAGELTLEFLSENDTPLCQLVRPFLPSIDLSSLGGLPV